MKSDRFRLPRSGRTVLDLFCGAGGAGMGYHRAGYAVFGVDNQVQPHYPFPFHCGDALAFLSRHGRDFDLIHASPPCQRYATVTKWTGRQARHPDLVATTRRGLELAGVPWVIENVVTSPLRPDLLLCGSMFGLPVKRHRVFETSSPITPPRGRCDHVDLLPFMHKNERAYADAMECLWMSNLDSRQAIPPAYTHYIGGQYRARRWQETQAGRSAP
jgi:C-5 cytosine-specific DNA methylase